MPVTADAALVPEGGDQRLAQGDAHVLHPVVGVDLQVAVGGNVEIDQAVAGDPDPACAPGTAPRC